MYCTADEVYESTTLDSSIVPEAAVNNFIKAAERDVDRFTFTTYWAVNNNAQTVDSATNNTISVSGTPYTADALIGMHVWVYSGTGIGQMIKITDNTEDTITVEENWGTNPVNGDLFRVIYTATDPRFNDVEDGNGEDWFFTPDYPIQILNSVTIDDVSVSTSNIYQYKKMGKLVLKSSAEVTTWRDTYPQQVELDYHYGVYPLPEEVKRYVVVLASLKTLAAQMGGTYATPSTYSLPEGSVTVGQAYVNIRGTFDVLMKEHALLREQILIRYTKVV